MEKREFQIRFFQCQIYELGSFKEYLEKKAAQGWMLEKREGMLCYFRKDEPKEVRFAVEAFEKAPDYTIGYIDSNKEYIDFCEAAGWKFVCATGKVQIFYTEDKSVVPIETDAKMKLKSIHNRICSENLWGWIIMFFAGIGIFNLNLNNVFDDGLMNYMNLSIAVLWGVIPLINGAHAVTYLIWYYTMKKKIENGEEFSYGKNFGSRFYIVLLMGTIFVLWVIGGYLTLQNAVNSQDYIWLSMFAMIPFVVISVMLLKILIQKFGLKGAVAKAFYYVGIAITPIIITGVLAIMALMG